MRHSPDFAFPQDDADRSGRSASVDIELHDRQGTSPDFLCQHTRQPKRLLTRELRSAETVQKHSMKSDEAGFDTNQIDRPSRDGTLDIRARLQHRSRLEHIRKTPNLTQDTLAEPMRIARLDLQTCAADKTGGELVHRTAEARIRDLGGEQQSHTHSYPKNREQLLYNPSTQTLQIEPDEVRGLHTGTLLGS